MLLLEKNNNYIRKISNIGPWFLTEWREITKTQIEDGALIIGDTQLHIEIEGNIMLFDTNYLTIDGVQFNDSLSLKNYIING